jgi:hypothetical protein
MDDVFEIMFRDLTPEAQARFLTFVGLEAAVDGNYDVFPIAQFDRPIPEQGDDEKEPA